MLVNNEPNLTEKLAIEDAPRRGLVPIFSLRFVGASLVYFIFIVFAFAITSEDAFAQTATVTASTGQSCAGTRFGSDLNCTSNDFTTSLSFTQPAATALASCRAGETISVDVIGDVTSSAPARYDAGFFIGEAANDPRIDDATKTCSNAVFPTSPVPFQDSDGDVCGDFQSSGVATLLIQSVQLTCSPAPGTNELAVPYTMVFSNQVGGATCTAANITANTKAKCVSSVAATVTGVDVNGFITVTKQTDPAGDAQSFTFSGSSTDTVTPSSSNLTDGQSQTFDVPLDSAGGTRTLTISESVVSGWDTTASITCVTPSGASAASYVTVNNATRTITADLDATNFGAVCTVINHKLPILTLAKTVSGGSAVSTDWTLSYNGPSGTGQGVSGDASITNVVVSPGTYTLAESAGPAFYNLSGVACSGTDADGSDGVTLSYGEIVACTFTNSSTLADLVTVKTLASGDATPGIGDTVTFLITVTNSGPNSATTVTLTDSLPAGLTATVNNGTVTQGTYVAGTGVWSVGTLANGASETLTLEGTVDVGQGGTTITNTTTAASGDQPDPGTTGDDLTESVVVDSALPASLSGFIWVDSNHDRNRNETSNGRGGWTVELFTGDINGAHTILDSTITASDGSYGFTGLPPGSNYGVIFRNPDGNYVYGVIDNITLIANTATTEQNQPIDPSGVVYDVLTRDPVSGAVVTLSGPPGFDPDLHLLGGVGNVSQTTGSTGEYKFLLLPTAPAGLYSLSVINPVGYILGPSTSIPACTTPLTVGPTPDPVLVHSSDTAPVLAAPIHDQNSCAVNSSGVAAGASSTQYYFSFFFNPASGGVINNHIPIEAIRSVLFVSKTTPKADVSRGTLVPYTIRARNDGNIVQSSVVIVDQIPPGFKYRRGSASINGVSTKPTISGRTLTFSSISVGVAQTATVKLILVVGTGVGEGNYINQAWAVNSVTSAVISNIAKAVVRVVPDPTFDCSDIIGKVFDDHNRNGYQDDGEPGIENVRMATVRGLLVKTDRHGRFHVACADIPDEDRGSNFIMKLDTRTLPTGYRVTTENPRVIRLTRGKLAKLNFGAAIHRVVRIDVKDRAFVEDGTKLSPRWLRAIGKVVLALKAEESVLRIGYRRSPGEPISLVKRRMAALIQHIQSNWLEAGGGYDLQIETEIYAGRR